MNEQLCIKLKLTLIKSLLSNEQIVDEIYLIRGDKSYTRKELAKELEIESEFGLQVMTNILKLSIEMFEKNIKNEM